MFVDSKAYETYMGRWSRRLTPLFVDFVGIPPGARVVDVGCGTGSLTEAVLAAVPDADVQGFDPSPGFVELARQNVPGARFEVGDAQDVSLADGSVDVALSSLVLNFVPDPGKAVGEMRRVTRPGGVIASVLWDLVDGGMRMLCAFWDVATQVFPEDTARSDEHHSPLCRQGGLTELWETAGIASVEERPLDIVCEYPSFDAYWEPFLLGIGPAGSYVAQQSEQRRAELRAALHEAHGDGPITLPARAWAVRGVN